MRLDLLARDESGCRGTPSASAVRPWITACGRFIASRHVFTTSRKRPSGRANGRTSDAPRRGRGRAASSPPAAAPRRRTRSRGRGAPAARPRAAGTRGGVVIGSWLADPQKRAWAPSAARRRRVRRVARRSPRTVRRRPARACGTRARCGASAAYALAVSRSITPTPSVAASAARCAGTSAGSTSRQKRSSGPGKTIIGRSQKRRISFARAAGTPVHPHSQISRSRRASSARRDRLLRAEHERVVVERAARNASNSGRGSPDRRRARRRPRMPRASSHLPERASTCAAAVSTGSRPSRDGLQRHARADQCPARAPHLRQRRADHREHDERLQHRRDAVDEVALDARRRLGREQHEHRDAAAGRERVPSSGRRARAGAPTRAHRARPSPCRRRDRGRRASTARSRRRSRRRCRTPRSCAQTPVRGPRAPCSA